MTLKADANLHLGIVGAGPAGLALALFAAQALPQAQITIFDARPLHKDLTQDPRTLALSLGSVQLLQRLGAWPQEGTQAIEGVHISQTQTLPWGPTPQVVLTAQEEGVAQLGAVVAYGTLLDALQKRWLELVAQAPQRRFTCFGEKVLGIHTRSDGQGAELEREGLHTGAHTGASRFDLVVVAEGGVFAEQSRKGYTHDYQQTAWVGQVTVSGARPGWAFERFTRQGPAALLPLPQAGHAALVWCVNAQDDPVRALSDEQRIQVLNHTFAPEAGRVIGLSPLKSFALGLNAEKTLVQGRVVRIGNAAQTMHPVAGQGFNLGLRDAYVLTQALANHGDVGAALRQLEWSRGPDRWQMILATDFLARSFTWQAPGLGAARGLGLAALSVCGPLKSRVAQHMMFGQR